MFNRNKAIAVIAATLFVVSIGFCQDIDNKNNIDNMWGDLVHYMAIARIDAAQDCANSILENDPYPRKIRQGINYL